MSSPKERLQEAAHRLAGSAEALEEMICPPCLTPDDPYGMRRTSQGDPRDSAPSSDAVPEMIKEGLKAVRQYADEIEEIVK